jgi:hypothetical protein
MYADTADTSDTADTADAADSLTFFPGGGLMSRLGSPRLPNPLSGALCNMNMNIELLPSYSFFLLRSPNLIPDECLILNDFLCLLFPWSPLLYVHHAVTYLQYTSLELAHLSPLTRSTCANADLQLDVSELLVD